MDRWGTPSLSGIIRCKDWSGRSPEIHSLEWRPIQRPVHILGGDESGVEEESSQVWSALRLQPTDSCPFSWQVAKLNSEG